MKTIYKFIFAITAAAAVFTSCSKNVKYANTLSVSPSTEITFDGEAPVNVDLQVTADGDWYIYTPSWIKATPSHGTGNTKVTLAASKNVDDYNELQAPRSGEVDVCGYVVGKKSEDNPHGYAFVSVSQNGEPGLDATKYMTKITKLEEFEAGYNYLITATVSETINACMPCAAGVDDNSFAYMYPTTVKANDEGVIVQDNGSLCFKLEASSEAGKYVIKQPNGSYLYQSSGYANFYNTKDVSKASLWTISFDADGNAVLTNTSAADRILQYSTSYKNFCGNSGDIQSGNMLPVLYKDMAQPSSEVISAPANTYALASATSAAIKITSNRSWKVRCHDSWVKSIVPAFGEGDDSIEITMDANTGDADRTATIQIIGETTNFYISLTQSAPIETVAELADWAMTGATRYEIDCEDVSVSYVNGANAYLEDETGGILLYKKNHGFKAGDVINGKISGNITLYSNLPELTSAEVAETAIVTTGDVPCTTVTIADLIDNYEKYLSCRIKLEGVTVTKGVAKRKDKGTVSQGENSITVYAQADAVMTEKTTGDLICYPAISGTTKQLSFWQTSDYTEKQ